MISDEETLRSAADQQNKRKRGLEEDLHSPTKRLRLPAESIDRLSRLSDELLVRIFSELTVQELNVCQRLSREYAELATDPQLWKLAYYRRFVRPSSLRSSRWREQLSAPATLSRWMRGIGGSTLSNVKDWKWQYRLRHNWSKGQCVRNEVIVDEERPLPPLHICMHGSIVYTADTSGGLRSWSIKGERRMLGKIALDCKDPPTALAIDKSRASTESQVLMVGFRDGSFSIYNYDANERVFKEAYTHPASTNGLLVAASIDYPFLVTMTAGQLVSVYKLDNAEGVMHAPILLHSLRSRTIWPPMAVSLRALGDQHVVAITYVIPTVLNWNVGIQELYIDGDGKICQSRTASSAYAGGTFGSRTSTASNGVGLYVDFSAAAPAFSKPSSISYSHPYLLLSHPDNTLTMFMVKSTNEDLSISSGTRLWGHTSSVSGAHIEDRGKAVSVSARGEELRIWELEGSLGRRWLLDGNWSIRVTPSQPQALPHVTSAAQNDDGIMRNWVAFDDENVVVLKERPIGRTDLVVYDFT